MPHSAIQDLGDGLILRRATLSDTDKLVAFQGDVQRDSGAQDPDKFVAAWVRDLMTREHPTFHPGDFTIVEDTHTGDIVSSLCLISQTWTYGGIPFGVGRPELVGTHPDYRNRGLVRAQFDLVHTWSAERGETVQAITGIPWYYRQFGYEMAMTLGGASLGYKPHFPKLKDGETETYRIRPATTVDLASIAEAYEYGTSRCPVACLRDEALWRCELEGKSADNVERQELCVIEDTAGEFVGFLAHAARMWQNRVGVDVYELKPGISWLAVTPSVIRYLWAQGEKWAARDPSQEMQMVCFWVGPEHPIRQVYRDRLPDARPPYAWYLRVPDVAGFVAHIAPVLEHRLADSLLVGYTGELDISFYRTGLRLVFDRGRLIRLDSWQPTSEERGNAAFPDLTFLQLLFGYRALEELKRAFVDCWTAGDEPRSLLEILFPRKASDVWPVS